MFLGQNYHDQSKAEHTKTILALKVKDESCKYGQHVQQTIFYTNKKNKAAREVILTMHEAILWQKKVCK